MNLHLSSKSIIALFIVFFGSTIASFAQCGVSVSVTDNGDGTSTILAVATGASSNGSDSYTYSWDTGQSGDQITVNNDGSTYCVTVTDNYTEQVETQAGYWVSDGYYDYYGYWVDTSYYVDPVYADQPQTCSASDCGTVSTVDCSSTFVIIDDSTPGQLLADVTGGTGNITYVWTPNGETTASINIVAGTTNYGVTITDANGCTDTDTYTVTSGPPDPDFTVDDAAPCKGQSISLTDNSSNNPTSWQWTMTGGTPASSTAQNPSVTYNTPGTYTISMVATNSAGTSTTSAEVQIVVAGSPTVSVLSQTVCSGDLTALVASGADSYVWNNGYPFSILPVTATATTNYTVVGTTDCGTMSATGHVTVKPNPTIGANSSTICAGNSTTLTATGGTGYNWNNGSTSAAIVVSPASTTVYNVTGTGSNGCTGNKSVTVTVNPGPVISANSPTICAGKTATLSASGATSYHWNTGPNTANISVTPSVTTVYTVTGTASTCSTSLVVTVNVEPLPTVSVISTTICTGSAATLIASGANTYSWNTGSTNANLIITPTVNTNYTVTGTSLFGCVKTATGSVHIGTIPVITVNSPTICSGTTVTLTASGVNSFTWNTGANTSSILVNPASTSVYTVAGSLTGCSTGATKTATVTVKASPTTAVTSQTICNGSSTTLTASGASTYSWNTGSTLPSILVSPSVTTIYNLTGVGSNGCSSLATATVSVKPSPTIAVNSATICNGATTTLIATGSTSYSWSNSFTTNSIVVAPTVNTNYTVTSTNNGCSASKIVTVTVNPLPPLTVVSPTICSAATATVIASGASTYSWSTGSTSNSFTVHPTSTTVYTVTGTSLLGCVKTMTASVTIAASPAIALNSTSICAGSATTLIANGVTSYTWNNGLHTNTISVSPTSTTVYTVSGNLTGCTGVAIANATVVVNSIPVVSLAPITNSILCTTGPIITLIGSPTGGNYFGTGVSGNGFNPSVAGAGTYAVTYSFTSAAGCSAQSTRSVTVAICSGVEELTLNNVVIYPNPTKDILNISFNTAKYENVLFELYNSIGQLIISEKIVDLDSVINMRDLANGIYFVKIGTRKNQIIKKVIKEN